MTMFCNEVSPYATVRNFGRRNFVISGRSPTQSLRLLRHELGVVALVDEDCPVEFIVLHNSPVPASVPLYVELEMSFLLFVNEFLVLGTHRLEELAACEGA